MKNADIPAMPSEVKVDRDQVLPIQSGHNTWMATGLTKREMFAMHAMQGLLSNSGGPIQARPDTAWGWCNSSEELLAVAAIQCADAVLDALEEKK